MGNSTTQAQHHVEATAPHDHDGYQPLLGFRGRGDYNGMKVLSVKGNTLAWRLGLEAGDVITHVNGVKVESYQQYLNLLRHATTHHDGRVRLRIENIRWHTGESNSRFVYRVANFSSPNHGHYCDEHGHIQDF